MPVLILPKVLGICFKTAHSRYPTSKFRILTDNIYIQLAITKQFIIPGPLINPYPHYMPQFDGITFNNWHIIYHMCMIPYIYNHAIYISYFTIVSACRMLQPRAHRAEQVTPSMRTAHRAEIAIARRSTGRLTNSQDWRWSKVDAFVAPIISQV